VLGPIAYGVAGIGPMLAHKPFTAKVSWKSNVLELETHQIIVVNGRYYGHEPIAPDQTPVNGTLAFFATSGTTRMDIVRTYFALLRGQQADLRDAHTFYAKKITVKTKGTHQPVSIDGDALCDTPITFSVAPKALRVMVPASFPEGI
jgi:diacylglycerol kinase family enzyme